MQTLIVVVLVFGSLIFIHELGHFLAAKRAGIRVEEFALGFGPRLASRRIGETEYSLRLFLVLGGFVRMSGMGEGREPDEPEDPRGFNQKTPLARASVLLAGPAANFVLAILVFFVMFTVVGIEQPVDQAPIIGRVEANYPSDLAGLRPGDRVVSINGKDVATWEEMVLQIRPNAGKPLEFVIERQGRRLILTITPVPYRDQTDIGVIGVSQRTERVRDPVWTALPKAVVTMFSLMFVWFKQIFLAVTGQATLELGGALRIGAEVNQAAEMGLGTLLSAIAFLSTQLGLFNLLPIPALDGGRLMFVTLEAVRGRPLDPERENFVHFIGFALLLLVFFLVTWKDIQWLRS